MVQKVAFIGAGSMAEAIMAGMVNKKFLNSDQIHVTNRENEERLQELRKNYQVVCNNNKEEVLRDADIVIFATKPYDMESAVKEVSSYITEDQLVISVVAGVSIDFIARHLNKKIAIIRSMPNTSATIGYSATAIAKGKYASEQDMELARQLFKRLALLRLLRKIRCDAVTGLSEVLLRMYIIWLKYGESRGKRRFG